MKRPEIFIVEDNQRLREALKSGLEETGKLIIAFDCESGESAIEYCQECQPNAILMDVQLAGDLNGIHRLTCFVDILTHI